MKTDQIRAQCIQRLQQLPQDNVDDAAATATIAAVRSALGGQRFANDIANNVDKMVRAGNVDRAVRYLEVVEIKPKGSTVVYVVVLLVVGALITGLGMFLSR